MGQQMGKEAEPPMICSTENPESGHTQRREEEGSRYTDTGMYSKTGKERDIRKLTIRKGAHNLVLIILLHPVTTFLHTVTPYRAANKRLRANLSSATWPKNLFLWPPGRMYF